MAMTERSWDATFLGSSVVSVYVTEKNNEKKLQCFAQHKIHYALFGCTEMISRIELSGNSKFRMEMKWLTIQILLFGWL
jgi:hypothetical protein